MQLCKFCGAGHLYISQSKADTIIYCGTCGEDYREKRDIPMEVWIDKKQGFQNKRMKKIG